MCQTGATCYRAACKSGGGHDTATGGHNLILISRYANAIGRLHFKAIQRNKSNMSGIQHVFMQHVDETCNLQHVDEMCSMQHVDKTCSIQHVHETYSIHHVHETLFSMGDVESICQHVRDVIQVMNDVYKANAMQYHSEL